MYMLFGPISGSLASDTFGGKSVILLGILLQCVGLLFIGPAPFLFLSNQIWTNVVGLILIGLGGSFAIIPSLSVLSSETNLSSNNDTISGVASSLFALGAFLGPIYGSSMSQVIGFAWATTILSGLIGLVVFLYFGVALKELCEYFEKSRKEENVRINR